MVARLALAALLVALVGPPASAETTRHVHTSQRFDRAIPLLARDIARDVRRADLVTVTEVQERRRARVLYRHRPAWGVATDGRTDLGIMWRRDRWRLVGRYVWHLAPGYPDVFGTWALAVRLVPRAPYVGPETFVSVAHLPSAVQDGDRWRRASRRVAAWSAAVAAWHGRVRAARIRWHPGAVLTVADWNVDLRRPVWRRTVRAAFPAERLTWRRPFPARGTHAGGRIIDGTLTTESGRARLLPRTAASDHRAYRETLTLDD
jgi:translation initiation factor IF-1